MIFSRLKHYYLSPIVILSAFISNFACASGGSSSNGGGGDRVDQTNWVVANPQLDGLLSQVNGPSYSSRLRQFREAYPNAIVIECPFDHDRKYLELPPELDSSFRFELRTGTQTIPFRGNELCNNERLLDAFGTLAMTLIESHQTDPVAQHLIQQVVRHSGPIPVLIAPERQVSDNVGGQLEEFSWFDHANGKIGWAPRAECHGLLECILRRGTNQILRHELAHVLLYRALGSHYPQLNQWHDVSIPRHMLESGAYSSQNTSPAAAWIEGFAGALEGPSPSQHPYIVDYGWFNHIISFQGQGYCYWQRFSTPRPSALFNSETYVGSALRSLFTTQDYNAHAEQSGLGLDFNLLMNSSHVGRMNSAIDAVLSAHPENVIQFARAFDIQTNSHWGAQFAREFFFVDEEGLSTLNEISSVDGRNCVSEENASHYLSYALHQEADENRLAAQDRFARTISQTALDHDFDNQIGAAYENLRSMTTRYSVTTWEVADAEQRAVCNQRALSESDRRDEIYQSVESRFHLHVSLADISIYIQSSCPDYEYHSPDLATLRDRVRQKITAAQLLRDRPRPSYGQPGYGALVATWMNRRRALQEELRNLEVSLAIGAVINHSR